MIKGLKLDSIIDTYRRVNLSDDNYGVYVRLFKPNDEEPRMDLYFLYTDSFMHNKVVKRISIKNDTGLLENLSFALTVKDFNSLIKEYRHDSIEAGLRSIIEKPEFVPIQLVLIQDKKTFKSYDLSIPFVIMGDKSFDMINDKIIFYDIVDKCNIMETSKDSFMAAITCPFEKISTKIRINGNVYPIYPEAMNNITSSDNVYCSLYKLKDDSYLAEYVAETAFDTEFIYMKYKSAD